jgi:O-antigen ligase/tetratricopeptide (TPR) repeat protein
MRRGKTWQLWIAEGLFLTGALIILITTVEMVIWYFGLSVLPQFSQSWPQIAGLTVPPVIHEAAMALNYNNPTGAYCLLVIPPALAGAKTIPKRDLRRGALGIAVGLTLVALLTQSRGAYLGLAALGGMEALLWLLRAENRSRFPARLRPMVAPPVLIAGAVLVALGAFGAAFWSLSRVAGGADRLHLWLDAVEVFQDHPFSGVGPHQFAAVRLSPSHWERSYSLLPLQHAHSLPLNLLAEGGLLGLTAAVWLLVTFGKTWWAAWRDASLVQRRRLEGVLVALVALGAHSMVDTFIQTQLVLPVVIMTAYVVAGNTIPSPESSPTSRRRRRIVWGALATLLIAQVAFIPILRGAWAHQRMFAALGTGRLEDALAATRAAQKSDPWFDLYRLQEANLLGRLAHEDPDTYLAAAIEAHENSLRRVPSWALGWHNLGALCAQAGRYEDAIAAAQTAIAWDSLPSGYHLKLGEYYTALDRNAEARAAFLMALRRQPGLAASRFWTDPAHPERADILADALDMYTSSDPLLALDLAMYAGDLNLAIRIGERLNGPGASNNARLRLDALWLEGSDRPCAYCYYVALRPLSPSARGPLARDYLILAERLLRGDSVDTALTAEKAARAALFVSEGQAAEGWYILARLAEREGGDAEKINAMLGRAAPVPGDYRSAFDTTVFGLGADLPVIPQARTPRITPYDYEPWLKLAARHEAANEWDEARTVYDLILENDPYAWDAQQRLDALPDD